MNMATIIDMPPGADIFKSKAQILVNPVNAQGVHGAGLAKAFASYSPSACHMFTTMAKRRMDRHKNSLGDRLKPGDFVVYPADNNTKHIVFFCTKDHYAQPSQLAWISEGMEAMGGALIEFIESYPSNTYAKVAIAIPALGCGLGGLDWHEVRPVIVNALQDIEGLTVELYPPHA